MPQDNTRGARSVTGRRRSNLGWLPWLAMLLLALIALVIVLVVRNIADDDDGEGVDVTNDNAAAVVYVDRAVA